MGKMNLFENIAGYEDVKQELMDIYGWYQDKELVNNKNIRLPRGILFFGSAGNGKTLFMREFVKSIKAKAFVINGLTKDLSKETHDAFENARKEKFALIIIDEIDLLIKKDNFLTRTLQSELDGLNENGRILVLATTNAELGSFASALLRQGRFDRTIFVRSPDKDDLKELFKLNLSKLNINYETIDLGHLSNLCKYLSCSDIKTIVNDAFLNSKENITTKDLEDAYGRLRNKDYTRVNPIKYKNVKVAIHEAGHAIMTMRYSKNFKLYNAKFTKEGGITNIYPSNDSEDTIEKRIEQIQISLSGAVAEKIFFKYSDIGSTSDYCKATNLIEKLIEKTCCFSMKNFHNPSISRNGIQRSDTEKHHRGIEKKCWKLLKCQLRKTKKYLVKHKKEIYEFAEILYKKGEVNWHDINFIDNKITKGCAEFFAIPNNKISFAYNKKTKKNERMFTDEYIRKHVQEDMKKYKDIFNRPKRDRNRIPVILREIEKIWKLQPDTRLGQLLDNVSTINNMDIFSIEDEDLVKYMNEMYDQNKLYSGVFWIVDKENLNNNLNYLFKIPTNGIGEIDSSNLIYELNAKSGATYNHELLWKQLPSSLTHNKSFDYYPRGKIHIANNKAKIYINPILNEPKIIEFLITQFLLFKDSIKKIVVLKYFSEHYKSHFDK